MSLELNNVLGIPKPVNTFYVSLRVRTIVAEAPVQQPCSFSESAALELIHLTCIGTSNF
jgi:hypothetical protein